MVVDTSALVAILAKEPELADFIRAIEAANLCRISAASWVETSIVVDSRYGAAGLYYLDQFISRAHIEVTTVDQHQASIARDAYQQYGKGRHPAGLNYGDCFSYALAATYGEPLLFKGHDFSQTDIVSVL